MAPKREFTGGCVAFAKTVRHFPPSRFLPVMRLYGGAPEKGVGRFYLSRRGNNYETEKLILQMYDRANV